jgi:hypothetical protein
MLKSALDKLTKEELSLIKLVASDYNVNKKPFSFEKSNTDITEITNISPFIIDLNQSNLYWHITPTQHTIDLLISLSYIDDLTCCSDCGAQLTTLDEGYGTPHSSCLDCLNVEEDEDE